MSPFPWREAMQFGFGVMRLDSRSFWGLTPRELAAAFAAHGGPRTAPPKRGTLEEMMMRYPDEARHG